MINPLFLLSGTTCFALQMSTCCQKWQAISVGPIAKIKHPWRKWNCKTNNWRIMVCARDYHRFAETDYTVHSVGRQPPVAYFLVGPNVEQRHAATWAQVYVNKVSGICFLNEERDFPLFLNCWEKLCIQIIWILMCDSRCKFYYEDAPLSFTVAGLIYWISCRIKMDVATLISEILIVLDIFFKLGGGVF